MPSILPMAVSEAKESAVTEASADQPVRIVSIVGEGSVSPLKCAPWEEVMLHTVSTYVLAHYFLYLLFS